VLGYEDGQDERTKKGRSPKITKKGRYFILHRKTEKKALTKMEGLPWNS